MKRFKKFVWGLQKPTDNVVRRDDQRDEVIGKFLMLITVGLLGLVMLLLILFT